MWQQLLPGLRMTLVMTVLTGLIYPLAVTGLSQVLFRDKANGSLITVNGRVVGSELIGQNFTRPEYFQPRPSAAGNDGYDATASGGSNLGPTSKKLRDTISERITKYPDTKSAGGIPADAVTASASGLDPDISPENAMSQSARVANATGLPLAQV